MSKLVVVIVVLGLGCSAPPKPGAQGGAKIRKLEALGSLMKNEVNPSFSKLVFLLAHADAMDEDPRAVRSELLVAGTNFQSAIGKLRQWHNPPTESDQGRDVFLTYAGSLDGMTNKLMEAIGRDDRAGAVNHLELIADTCNNCHHFFRLDIEDSVVTQANTRSALQERDPAIRF